LIHFYKRGWAGPVVTVVMGRGVESFSLNMFAHAVNAFTRRQLSMIRFRLKYFILIGVGVLVIWSLLGESSKSNINTSIQEEKTKDYPDFSEDLSDGAQSHQINVKQAIHDSVQKQKDLRNKKSYDDKEEREKEKRKSLLVVPSDSQVPVQDIDNSVDNFHEVVPSRRQRPNSVNGVKIDRNSGDSDVEWVAVGGADIYRGHNPVEVDGHDEFAVEFAKQEVGVGEMGQPVRLYGKEQTLGEEVLKTEAFNLVASDKIVYDRQVPDTRDSRCQAVVYDNNLPTVSVVIIFTNEAWSPLIRTIYSVLNRSPAEFVHEIILVDDFSNKKHLGSKLERFIVKYFPSKVKLLRLKERQGLIRARLTGARAATGDVLLFLDSHCECNTGWLEPLLQRIKENPLAFVVPIIDVIDDKTLEYYHGNGNYFQVGGFTWSGHFTWIDISQQEMSRRGSPIAPTRSPTMAGGLYAVSRKTFWALGSYDEEMDVWGGENLEMSFRIWQCGAILETIPCSRVGHIFRSFHPYTFPGNKDTHGINTARTVEVWMDDYKKLFYMHRPDLLSTDLGSLENRLKFRSDMKCKSFSWFLDNIYPEKFVLDSPDQVFAYGRLRSPAFDTCLDNLQNEDKDSYVLGQYTCHKFMATAQFFSFSKHFELRREETCAQVSAAFAEREETVTMTSCHRQGGNQEWAHTKEGKIIHKATKKCLDAGMGQSMDSLFVAPCKNIDSQVWFFDHYVQS